MALFLPLVHIVFFLCYNSYGWQLKDYNPKANPTSVVSTNEARFTVITSNLIRMEYNPNSNFEDRQSITIVNRYTETPSFTHSINGMNNEISLNFP